MGDELVRAIKSPNTGLPKLTSEAMEQIFKETAKSG